MNLKSQTVYIPISFDRSFNVPRCIIATAEVSPREGKALEGGDMYLEPKQLICLSKEQLISFAEEVWNASKMHTIYRETPAPIGVTWDAPIPLTKEQFINNILSE